MVLINELMGDFGRYHFGLCALIFASKFGIAFHQMGIIFLAPPIDYKCPDTNSTCCEYPIFDSSMFKRTIVTEWNLTCKKAWLKDLHQTLFQLGVLIGSLLFGIASDKFGRRPTLITAAILEIFTGVMASFLPDYWSFTIVRMILGIAVAGVNVIGYVIMMEFVGIVHRNLVAALYHVPFTLGHILMALVGYLTRDYVYYQLTVSLFTTVLLMYICFLPESPRWLIAKNKIFKASKLMERVANINRLPVDDFYTKLVNNQMEHQNGDPSKVTLVDFFKTPNMRRNILIMSFTWMVCSYCFYGMAHYISYLTGDIFINVTASGGVCMCGCFVAIPIMKLMKRKTAVIVGNTSCGLCLLMLAVIPEGKPSVALGCVGLLFSYMIFILIYLYCSELFPTVVRNAAIGISSMMARFGSMVAPFTAGLRPHGQWCAPVAFGIFPLISAGLCFLLPETKDCDLPMTIEESEALDKK